jgi:hypothetical protein
MVFQWFDFERNGWLSNGLIMNVPDGFPMVDNERTGWHNQTIGKPSVTFIIKPLKAIRYVHNQTIGSHPVLIIKPLESNPVR